MKPSAIVLVLAFLVGGCVKVERTSEEQTTTEVTTPAEKPREVEVEVPPPPPPVPPEGLWTVDDLIASAPDRNQHGIPFMPRFERERLRDYVHDCPEGSRLAIDSGPIDTYECLVDDGPGQVTIVGTLVWMDRNREDNTYRLRLVERVNGAGEVETVTWHTDSGHPLLYEIVSSELTFVRRRYSESGEYLGGCILRRGKFVDFLDTEVDREVNEKTCEFEGRLLSDLEKRGTLERAYRPR